MASMNLFPRLLLLGSLFIVAKTGAAAVPPPAPAIFFKKLEAGEKQTVVVYGTSLTHGGAWAQATRQWFEQTYPGQVTFINSGGPGENSDWGLHHLQAKVLDHRPGLVFIEFSYNDAHEKFALPVERGAANLAKMVAAIRAQNPDTIVVLQTMNVGWDAPNGNRSLSGRPALNRYNENYRVFAREQGLPLLDHYAAWLKLKQTEPEKFQRYVPDGSHPTTEGSLALIWPAIKTWLEEARAAAR